MKGRAIQYFTTSIVLIFILLTSVTITGSNPVVQSHQPVATQSKPITNIIADTHNSSIEISGNTELEAYGLSGDGSNSTPFLIENVHITTPSGSSQILISDTTHWIHIRDSTLTNGTNGIWLDNVTNVIIENVTANLNNDNGIKVTGSEDVTVKESKMMHNGFACTELNLNYHSGSGGLFNPSTNLIVENNTIAHNYRTGLIVTSATDMQIIGNDIEDNGGSCLNSEVKEDYHSSHGIDLFNSSSVDIRYNSFVHNELYGIAISGDLDSINVTLNNFAINGYAFNIQQASDDTGITFNKNFWDDFDPEESTVYSIDGTAETVDDFPCNATVEYGDVTCNLSTAEEEPPADDTSDTDEGVVPVVIPVFVFITLVMARKKYRSA